MWIVSALVKQQKGIMSKEASNKPSKMLNKKVAALKHETNLGQVFKIYVENIGVISVWIPVVHVLEIVSVQN